MMRVRHPTYLGLAAVLLCAGSLWGDVTDSTPYDYGTLPQSGIERGTYVFNGYFSDGPPNCNGVAIGTAKFLPNGQGTGGTFCAKFNVQVEPSCPLGAATNSQLAVIG